MKFKYVKLVSSTLYPNLMIIFNNNNNNKNSNKNNNNNKKKNINNNNNNNNNNNKSQDTNETIFDIKLVFICQFATKGYLLENYMY